MLSPQTKDSFQVNADLVIGCDGAYSAIRRHMLQQHGFDYSQTYIEHGYIELCIPSNNNEVRAINILFITKLVSHYLLSNKMHSE